MSRVLVLYTSRAGHTARIADRIAQRLAGHGHDVDSQDIDHMPEDPDLAAYDGIVLGASITYGRHDRALVKLARRNNHILRERPGALFSVSLAAAHPQMTDTTTRHVQRFVMQTGWQPDLVGRIAGDLAYTQVGAVTRYAMKRHSARMGLATDTSQDHDYTDWARVDRFADAFDALLRKDPAQRRRGNQILGRTTKMAGIAAAAAAATAGVVAYERRWRPIVRHWGSTESERSGTLPGDDLVRDPVSTSTMAITIQAPPTDVWPWLAQLGARRAGWYSYDLFDSLGRRSSASIMPAHQHLQEGDLVPANHHGRVALPVKRLDPERHIVFGCPVDAQTETPVRGRGPAGNVTWGFHLKGLPGDRTRLIVRTMIGPGRMRTWTAATARFAELMHHVRQRRQFAELKVRAEGLLAQRSGMASVAQDAPGGVGTAT